jgi:hypothetical protein
LTIKQSIRIFYVGGDAGTLKIGNGSNSSEERNTMSRFVTILSAGIMATAINVGSVFLPTPAAAAMSDTDAAAMKKATADCKAEVGEKAKYHEMSWLTRHKMVKNCVKETLAKGH